VTTAASVVAIDVASLFKAAEDTAEPDAVADAAADSKLASAVLRMELTALVPMALSVATTDEALPPAGADEAATAAEEAPTADPVAEAAGTLFPAVAVAGACTCPSSIWLTALARLFVNTTLLLTCPIV